MSDMESVPINAGGQTAPSGLGSEVTNEPVVSANSSGRELFHGGDKVRSLNDRSPSEHETLAKLSEAEDVGDYLKEREEQLDEQAEEDGTLNPAKRASRSARYKKAVAAAKEEAEAAKRELENLRNSGVGLGPEHVEQIRAMGAFAARAEIASRDIPDFHEVVQAAAHLPITDHVASLVRNSDVGPRIAYELANAPEVLEQINGLPPAESARVIGRLEMLIANERGTSHPPKQFSKATKAPRPIVPVKGGASPTPSPEDLADNMGDYIKWTRTRGRS